MLFRWLSAAIRSVETGGLDDPIGAERFEEAYYKRYSDVLNRDAPRLGWTAEKMATAYGAWQILGENLARFHGLGLEHLDRFLSDERMQARIARAEFYRQLRRVIERRGPAWPRFLFSMWNAGINYNADYDRAIRSRLKGNR